MDDFDVDDVVQRALDRLTLLAEATTARSSTLDSRHGLSRVCRILVPQLADWAAVDLIEDDGRPRRVSVVHHDPEALPVGGLTGVLPPVPEVAVGPLARVPAGAGPLRLAARYMPAATTAEVGGDWYDSFTLPTGHTTMIIGDVTDHDLRAAPPAV